MIPSNWIKVSVVILPHCFLDRDVELLDQQRHTSAIMVAMLHAKVTAREKRPKEANVEAKTALPTLAFS